MSSGLVLSTEGVAILLWSVSKREDTSKSSFAGPSPLSGRLLWSLLQLASAIVLAPVCIKKR